MEREGECKEWKPWNARHLVIGSYSCESAGPQGERNGALHSGRGCRGEESCLLMWLQLRLCSIKYNFLFIALSVHLILKFLLSGKEREA